MKRLVARATAVVTLTACSHSTVAVRAATVPFSPAELQADVAKLRAALTEGHPALGKYRTPTEVDSIFRALGDSARQPLTAVAFWKHASIAVAGFRDDHTSLVPNSSIFTALYRTPGASLPLRLGIVDGRLFVVRNYLAGDGPPDGSEILAVNGATAQEFLRACTAVVPTDGDVALRAIRKVERDFELTCAMAHGMPAEYELTVRVQSGETRSLVVRARPWSERRTLLRAVAPEDSVVPAPGALSFADDSSVAILAVRSFSKGDGFDPGRFIDESFRRIHQSAARCIVVDLRGNTGGSDSYAAELYAHIATDTFTYYTRRELNKRRYNLLKGTDDWALNYMTLFISMQKRPDGGYLLRRAMDKAMRPRADAFTGQVMLLIDGNSISTSSEFASVFRARNRGTIVGEESGSALTGGTGATVSVVLPNTQLILNIPLVSAYIAPRPGRSEPESRGVLSDVPVTPTLADRLAGRDVVLEAALTLARSRVR